MRGIFLGVLIGALLGAGTTAFGASYLMKNAGSFDVQMTGKSQKDSSYGKEIVVGTGTMTKITDGKTDCYVFNSNAGISLSCVK